MADIGKLAQETKTDDEAVEVKIVDRNGEPYLGADKKPATFSIVGEYSAAYRANEKKLTARRMKEGPPDDPDELDERWAQQIACGIVGWSGWEDATGKPVAFSQKNVVALLLQAPWIAKQANKAIAGHASFFGKRSGD